jgi:HK97 family phage prohead protease
MVKIERRTAQLEIRVAKGRRLEGYAATFGTEARIGSGFTEALKSHAFANSLRSERDILALVDHDATKVLARTRSKTLRLSEDSRGLAFDLDVPQTSYGRDILALAERGDVGGASFGFSVRKNGEQWSGSKRTLTDIDLHEISIVASWPAYEGTIVAARMRNDETLDECVQRLLEEGEAEDEEEARELCEEERCKQWRRDWKTALRAKYMEILK